MPPVDRSTRLPWGACFDCRCRSNRTGRLLRLRPGDRLITGYPLLLIHVRLDQARIDRECFAANQPGSDALRHHALKYPAQRIALAKALMPCTAEYRMIGNTVFNAKLAKPSVG